VHTQVGNSCTGARINGHMESLDTQLRSGDMCEIIVDKKRKRPNPDWLTFVKTSTARSRIKSAEKSRYNLPSLLDIGAKIKRKK
jgi:(p)ppGpp synthase/HD superfamily hydrolase